jgi:membrane associated rhomboid family serine protease
MEGQDLDICPACMGLWSDAKELPRAAGLSFSDAATGEALAGAKRTACRCPACAIPLYEREIERGSGIHADQCPQCSGLFLDHQEFSRIKRYYAGGGAAPRAKRATATSRRAEQPTHISGDSDGATLFQLFTGLPLELDAPQTLFPPVVSALILLNLAVLVAAIWQGMAQWIDTLGVVPREIVSGHRLHTLLTSMFMHAGVIHFLGNMYFLYITGDNVEERFGRWKFLGFYLLCGVVADLVHILGHPTLGIPSVGASGAVSGVLGAYVVLFPHIRFRVRWFYFLWHHCTWDFPVYVYFGFWIALQFLYAGLEVPGVGWLAHIGGFACGAGIAFLVRWHAAKAWQHGDTQAAARRLHH